MNILGVSGSLRKDSLNTKLLRIALAYAEKNGAVVEHLDAKAIALPIFDEDVEAGGVPDGVRLLREKVAWADVILIATPEYNRSIPGGLKNAIDWLSRGENALRNKVGMIIGVSNGPFGTVRAQQELRRVLGELRVWMVPTPSVFVRMGDAAFTPDGSLIDAKTTALVEELVLETIHFAQKLHS